jgi:hypothetical protein
VYGGLVGRFLLEEIVARPPEEEIAEPHAFVRAYEAEPVLRTGAGSPARSCERLVALLAGQSQVVAPLTELGHLQSRGAGIGGVYQDVGFFRDDDRRNLRDQACAGTGPFSAPVH